MHDHDRLIVNEMHVDQLFYLYMVYLYSLSINAHMHTYIHLFMHPYMHTYIHTHTHIQLSAIDILLRQKCVTLPSAAARIQKRLHRQVTQIPPSSFQLPPAPFSLVSSEILLSKDALLPSVINDAQFIAQQAR